MTLKPEDPRPSPVGREEVARWICRTVRIAQGFEGTAEYTLDDEVHNAWDDWLDEADDLLALFSPVDGWRRLDETVAPLVPVLLWAPPERLYNEPEGKEGEYRIARPRDYTWATHWQPLPAAPPPPGGQG